MFNRSDISFIETKVITTLKNNGLPYTGDFRIFCDDETFFGWDNKLTSDARKEWNEGKDNKLIIMRADIETPNGRIIGVIKYRTAEELPVFITRQ